MQTPNDILKAARLASGFKTREEAVAANRKHDLNYFTLSSHENGNRPISRQAAAKYAKAFGVDPSKLLFNGATETDRKDYEVPLLSFVSAGNLRHQHGVEEHDIIKHITVGDLPKGDWVALQVDGDSMNRIAPDGAIILVDRADDRLVDGRFYIFALDEGEVTFKMFKRGPDRLLPYSTNPDHMATPAERDDLYVFGRVKRVINDI